MNEILERNTPEGFVEFDINSLRELSEADLEILSHRSVTLLAFGAAGETTIIYEVALALENLCKEVVAVSLKQNPLSLPKDSKVKTVNLEMEIEGLTEAMGDGKLGGILRAIAMMPGLRKSILGVLDSAAPTDIITGSIPYLIGGLSLNLANGVERYARQSQGSLTILDPYVIADRNIDFSNVASRGFQLGVLQSTIGNLVSPKGINTRRIYANQDTTYLINQETNTFLLPRITASERIVSPATEVLNFINQNAEKGKQTIVVTQGTFAFKPSSIRDFEASLEQTARQLSENFGIVYISPKEITPDFGGVENILATNYIDLNKVLTNLNVAGFIHHGGTGTTEIASKYGIPQLVIPHLYEQIENARRVNRDINVGVTPIGEFLKNPNKVGFFYEGIRSLAARNERVKDSRLNQQQSTLDLTPQNSASRLITDHILDNIKSRQ